MTDVKRAVLIAGPTASGKSALALDYAQKLNGVIVNTDSMQVYDVLNVLTARPGAAELTQAPHELYGVISPAVRFSTAAWMRAVEILIQSVFASGRVPIFAGGTGLYFQALIDGFSEVPQIPHKVIQEVEELIQPLDRAGRLALLQEKDPQMVERLAEPDPQRLTRALSVLAHTGRSLADWQSEIVPGLLGDVETTRIVVQRDRDVLCSRITNRFSNMFTSGAVEEVEALLALDLDPSLPAMKAIGVKEISTFLEGGFSQSEAIERAIIATRQYAKRQRTWFRNHMKDWDWWNPDMASRPK